VSISNTMLIAITEASDRVKRDGASLPLEDRLRLSFSVTRHHWLVTNEDERFKAGVGGVLLSASPDEQTRLAAEMRVLGTLSAAMTGVPIAAGALETGQEPVGLLRIWKESGGVR